MKKNIGVSALVALMVLAGCSNPAGGSSGSGGLNVGPKSGKEMVTVIPVGTTKNVNMADDSSWSGYISPSSYDSFKGVFINGRSVTLSPFAIGQYEVTQELYKAVLESEADCNANPSNFGSDPASGETQKLRPVENVTWYDAVYFCNALTKKLMRESDCVYTITNILRDDTDKYITNAIVIMDLTKKGYRLPTEAEWEFAARGGDAAADAWKYSYAGSNTSETNLTSQTLDTALNDYGWYTSNSSSKTHEVGLKIPNTLGLYDMSGNVLEWCWDFNSTVSAETVTDPTGPGYGSHLLYRGGSWNNRACFCSVSHRSGDYPFDRNNGWGFRLARSL